MTERTAEIETLMQSVAAWAEARQDVRAVAVIGSYARRDHPPDRCSDLDLLLVAVEPETLLEADPWPYALGEVVLDFVETSRASGTRERRVLFSDGIDVDFTIVALADLAELMAEGGRPDDVHADVADEASSRLAVIARGIRFLVDKDGLEQVAASIPPPAPTAPPNATRFTQTVFDYWYHALWAHRKLARGEVWVAVTCAGSYMPRLLLRMIEWHSRMRNPKSYDTWHAGRFLEEWADPDVVAALAGVFPTYDPQLIVDAIDAMDALFARLARDVADGLGLTYPTSAEEAVQQLIAGLASGCE